MMSRPAPLSLKSALLALLASAWLMTAGEAATFPVNQCAADRAGEDLGCTANDVSITGMAVIGDTTSCVGGSDVTLDLQLTVNFQNPSRYDIGIFISNDGKDPQIQSANGGAATCAVSVLPNSSPFYDLDGPTDTCGDGGDSLSGIHYMSNVTVPCQSLPGASGNLFIPFVVSWDVNKTPPGDVCTSNANPLPGAKSKCNAPTIVQGSVAVVVLPSITKDDGITTLFSGDTTSYDVTITNDTGDTLSGAIFRDPAVSGITANSVSCAFAGGASCPASSVAAMQGAGITIPDMPDGSSVTFTIGATLTGTPGVSRTNTATVAVGSQSNSASDTNIIVDTIAILPSTQAKSGDKGSTVSYSYTLYNFGPSSDTITLTALSGSGWTTGVSPTPVTVAAGGSTTVTVTATIPNGAAIGDLDTTLITATSGVNPTKTATATAVTTVTSVLTLVPSNTGAGGAGSSVYYSHRVQNNASSSKSVSLTPVLSGCTAGWSSALYQTDKTTALSSPVTLAANGGYLDFVLKVSIPVAAVTSSTCTATLTAQYTSGAANAVSVTDVTTVKNLLLYEDPGYTIEQSTYPVDNPVYAMGYGLSSSSDYEYRWYDASGTEVCLPRATSTTGTTFPDTCTIPTSGPLGTWTAQIWNTSTNALFVQSNFYVGPDHLAASYSGTTSPVINSDTVIDLALHDRYNHEVPLDGSGNLVKGDPSDTEGPLMVTVTVSGSASIISTTLTGAVITGQSVTGKLDSTSGTATLTIRDSLEESVTITPTSYQGELYGSPVRDDPVIVTFTAPPLNHIRLLHSGSGLTCTPSAVTVQACANADCTSLYIDSVSVTLSPSGWEGGDTVSFSGGSASYNLWHTTPGAVTLGASSAASGATRCFIGATESCTHTFADAGFIFTVPTLTANKTSAPLTISAVKTSDSGVACTPAFSGARSVSLWSSYANPVSGTTQVSVNGTAVGTASPGTALNLTFDANAQAELTVHYADAGLLQLDASYAGSGDDAGLVLTGNSQFVVKPAGYCVMSPDANSDCASGDATCSAFVAAGADFNLTVSAMAWESDADSDLCAGNAITPNFQLSGIPLAHSLVAPAGGADGTLGLSTIDISSNGTATLASQSISEVGVFTITAQDSNYLGVTTTASTSANIGRFYPDAFTLNITDHGTFAAGCPTCTTPFTYLGDSFGYDSGDLPQVTINAVNLAGDITVNYRGDFAKLATAPGAAITFGYPTADSTTDNADASGKLGVSSSAGTPTISANGDGTLALVLGASLMDLFTYDRELVSPFAADLSILINSIFDGDVTSPYSAGNVITPVSPHEQRYGRAVVEGAFGSSVAGTILTIPLALQYFDATGNFVEHSDDTVTTIDATYLTCSDPNDSDTLGCLPVSGTPGNGGVYTLTADGNSGTLYYLLDLSAATGANLEFLQFDWDEDTTEDSPQATVVLGTYPNYHGDGRFRIWLEGR